MLTHAYDYGSILETSQRINWKIEDVIGDREFDFSRLFLPDAIAGVAGTEGHRRVGELARAIS